VTPATPDDVDIAWLTGPPRVGASTIAWEVFQCAAERSQVGFVDVRQLTFIALTGSDARRATASAVAASVRAHIAHGAHRIVLAGSADPDLRVDVVGALGRPPRILRLDADADALLARTAARAAGEGPNIPGDTVRGADSHAIRQLAAASRRAADSLASDPRTEQDEIVDTTARTATEAAAECARRLGWA
jgi:hypothetical protein